MSSLLLVLDDAERRLPEQDPHYLWMDAGVLKVSTNPPSHDACVGTFVSEFGAWAFHSGPSECPPELRINGSPVSDDVELPADRAEVRLSAEPYSEPPPSRAPGHGQAVADEGPPPSGRQWQIGPLGSDAHLKLDDPAVVEDHARVEVDGQGAWWITAHNGEVYVEDEPVASAKLAPGATFRIGHRLLTVPSTGRRGRGSPVECAELSARHGADQILDNVSFSVDAGDFVAVYGREPAAVSMLLGLIAGVYRADHGAVRIGGSSRRGPGVRWVPATDDLHGSLTVGQTLAGVESDRREEILSWLGLSGDTSRQVRTLDDGERKRLAIARELAERPTVLVVFEAGGSSNQYSVGGDRDLITRLAAVSHDTGCTVLIGACTTNNLEYARTVVVIDRRGRLRYAGPSGRRADFLAAVDSPVEEPEPGRNHKPGKLPAMRARPVPVGGLDGLAATVRQQALLFRARGNAVHVGLGALAVAGSGLVFASFAYAPFELAAVAVMVALTVGGADLVTARPVLARERRSGVSAAAMVTGRLLVHGAVCAVMALPLATAATLDAAALPRVPGLSAWLSCYFALLLTLLFVLSAAMLATAAAPPDNRLSTPVVIAAAAGLSALILLCWYLLSASWLIGLPSLPVLTLSGVVAAAVRLEHRIARR